MTTAELNETRSTDDTDRVRVMHWFPGYENPAYPPPVGAISACGFRRRTASGRHCHLGDPEACVVCHELAHASGRR